VVLILVVVSLVLLSVYFKESSGGPLHALQSAGTTILRPFEVGAEHVARPFRDAVGWFDGLLHAKSDAAKYKAEVADLQRQVNSNAAAKLENKNLKDLLRYREGPTFPTGFRGVAARIIARPSGDFVQQVVIGAGSNSGIRLHAPVVTGQGLLGQVTKVAKNVSQVTLLTDGTSAASGLDVATGATGIVEYRGDRMFLDLVTKSQVVAVGERIVTAGWRSGKLSDIYPKGIPIGIVSSSSQRDTDTYKTIQMQPYVDFGSLESVLVLVATGGK
jgi:rod shape-determining protein MreC